MIRLALRGDISGAGSVFSSFSIAPFAIALRSPPFATMSSSSTGTPALAICAAMPEPMTPEPITATFLIPPLAITGAP